MASTKKTLSTFKLEYKFFEETRTTELLMLVDGNNILEFKRNGKRMTTRWDLRELCLWLRDFLYNLRNDPYPVEVEGEFAAQKDAMSRDFECDDIDEFDNYYDQLDEWNLRHRWHTACSGAILADLYFQLVDDKIEISWNNNFREKNVEFTNVLGGCAVNVNQFVSEVEKFLSDYADYWYKV